MMDVKNYASIWENHVRELNALKWNLDENASNRLDEITKELLAMVKAAAADIEKRNN